MFTLEINYFHILGDFINKILNKIPKIGRFSSIFADFRPDFDQKSPNFGVPGGPGGPRARHNFSKFGPGG